VTFQFSDCFITTRFQAQKNLAGGRFGQTKVLGPYGDNVISGLAKATAAHDGRLAHLDGTVGSSHDLVTHGAFLLSFRIHTFRTSLSNDILRWVPRKTEGLQWGSSLV
jgi:hypothetical protein